MNRSLLYGLLCLVLLSACKLDQEEPTPVGADDEPQKYYFSGILHADELELKESQVRLVQYELSPSSATMRGQIFELYAHGTMHTDYAHSFGALNAEFKRLADSIGDGNYYRPHSYSTHGGAYRHTLSSGIRSLSLTALGQYNATLPKGSDLSASTQAYWVDLEKAESIINSQQEMERIWRKYGKSVQAPFSDYSKHEHMAPLSSLKDVHLPAMKGYYSREENGRGKLLLAFILLPAAPSESSQSLRISLSLMDGRVLTRDVRLRLGN